MTKTELLLELKSGVTPEEWEALWEMRGIDPMTDSILDTLSVMYSHDVWSDEDINPGRLRAITEAFSEMPQGHSGNSDASDSCEESDDADQCMERGIDEPEPPEPPIDTRYIDLAMYFMSLISEEPIHPQDMVGWITSEENGRTVYRCPYKGDEEGHACVFCACRPMV